MKLHLNKALRLAVMACFAAASAAYGFTEIAVQDGLTYKTNESGELVVIGGMSYDAFTFQLDLSAIAARSSDTTDNVAYRDSNYDWGFVVMGTGESSYLMGKWNSGTYGNGTVTYSNLPDDGIVTAGTSSNNKGTRLGTGVLASGDTFDLYNNDKLMTTSPGTDNGICFNGAYVSAIYTNANDTTKAMSHVVISSNGSWNKAYASVYNVNSGNNSPDVSAETVAATLITDGRLDVKNGNVQNLNDHGGDIVIGNKGQIFFDTYSTNGNLVLKNNIIVEGSTHSDASTWGTIRFGTDSGTTTLNGSITIVADTTMGSNGSGQDVYIKGAVSGNHKLSLVKGTEIQFKGGMNIGTLEFLSGVATTIADKNATIGTLVSVSGSGDTKLTVNNATVSVTGNASEMARLITDANGVINIAGDYSFSKTGVDFRTEGSGEVNIDGDFSNTGGRSLHFGANVTIGGTFSTNATAEVTGTLTLNGTYASASEMLTTKNSGSIVFGAGATIDVANLTQVGSVNYKVDGFIQEAYRVTASGVNASITGDSISLVNGSLSLGTGTWNDGVVSMGDAIYNVATTKSYSEYLTAAADAGKAAASILVQSNGIFQANDKEQTIAITGDGTLQATWSGRAVAGAAISAAAKTFHGDVVVKSGASWLIGNDYSFSSVTVESGGQFGLDGTYTGNITISGVGAGSGDNNGALKFGNGGTLSGNLTIVGNKAALSTWGTAAGTITGNVTSTTEGGVELEILNGTSATTSNTITVDNNLSGINKVTTTGGSMTVAGTVTGFGDTFTKDGAGTLTLSKAGAMTSGKVIVNAGTLALTGSGSDGTLSGVAVEVNAGATVQVGHDCAGWSGGTSSITLLGEKGKVAKMVNDDTTNNGNTWNTDLNLKGYATVEGGNLMSFGGALNAEGTNNTFTSKLLIAKNYTVTVADGGELEISGQIVNSEHGQKETTAQLIKEGAGNLTLSNTNNTFTRGGIALNAGTLTIANDEATTTAAAISGNGALATSGDGAKTFSDAVNVGSLTATGGDVTFDGALTLNGKSSIGGNASFGGLTTLNGDLTVTGATTLNASASISIANGKTFTSSGEAVTSQTTGVATITGTGTVSVGTEGLIYTNALIDTSNVTDKTLAVNATMRDSKVVNNNSDVKVTIGADSLDGTSSISAESGDIDINGAAATVKSLYVSSDKVIAIGGDAATPGTITVAGSATVGGTVSGNVTLGTSASFTADEGARVEGNLYTADGALTLTTIGTDVSADGVLDVDGTLALTIGDTTNISLAEQAKTSINEAIANIERGATLNFLLAKAGLITGVSESLTGAQIANLLGIEAPAANVTYSLATATTFARSATTYLTLTATAAPDTLTATGVGGYDDANNMLTIKVNGENISSMSEFDVTVSDALWNNIVSTVEGDPETTSVRVTLLGTDGSELVLDTDTNVTFNGCAGEADGSYIVANIPEPATATLSLLALAALAARRRRK